MERGNNTTSIIHLKVLGTFLTFLFTEGIQPNRVSPEKCDQGLSKSDQECLNVCFVIL